MFLYLISNQRKLGSHNSRITQWQTDRQLKYFVNQEVTINEADAKKKQKVSLVNTKILQRQNAAHNI